MNPGTKLNCEFRRSPKTLAKALALGHSFRMASK